ncbi:MAG: sugar ABC transporter substrate-binding protein, partial [Hungatella sp.]|nr:sugar ABC transporter substrate-binding protein [Hungatella sp.]
MKKRNKFWALGLTAAMAATSLAGCGGGNGGGDANAPLTVAIWDSGQQAGLQEILNAFTEST